MVNSKFKIYRAFAYYRLSKDDGDKGESNSIINQRKLVSEFVSASDDIQLAGECYDDGYTGTNFDRPGFQKLFKALESGKTDCVIVKDLSRLGRDYIETGKYIEKIFPSMGIRFIAINDHVDSLQKDQSDEIIIPFKNLINDSYCRELSIKLRKQFKVQRGNGEFIGNFACYGYRKSREDKHKLVIDEDAADVVRMIFAKRIEGYSCQNIAEYLNSYGFLAPSDYKRSIGENYQSGFKEKDQSKWGHVQVRRILTNRIYVGDLEQGKRSSPNYKIKKLQEKNKDEWIVVQGTHEAIVSEEVFQTVERIMQMDSYTAPAEDKVYPLSGIMFCKDCGSSMIRRKVIRADREFCYYICNGNKKKKICASSHSMERDSLHEKILHAIQMQINMIVEMEELLEEMGSQAILDIKVKRFNSQIEKKTRELEQQQEFRMKLYENKVEGLITHEEYLMMRQKYTERIEETTKLLEKLEKERQEAMEQNAMDCSWMQSFKENRNVKELTRELVVTLIDRIEVCEDKSIEITFRFRDEYRQLQEYLGSAAETAAI